MDECNVVHRHQKDFSIINAREIYVVYETNKLKKKTFTFNVTFA